MRVAGQRSQCACLKLPRPENATRSNCAILQWLKLLPRVDGNHTHAAITLSQQNPSPHMAYSKYICLAGAIIILSSGPVSAQDFKPGISMHPDAKRSLDPDEQ